MANVTKQDFIDRVASKSDLSKRDASKAVDAFLDTVTESLRRGESITFTGFGKFSTANARGAHGREPSQPGREGAHPGVDRSQVLRRQHLKQAVKRASGGGARFSCGGTSRSAPTGTAPASPKTPVPASFPAEGDAPPPTPLMSAGRGTCAPSPCL